MNALISLSVLAVLLLLSGLFSLRRLIVPIAVIGLLTVIGLAAADWNTGLRWYNDMMFFDNYAIAFSSLMAFITLLIVLLLNDYIHQIDIPLAETAALLVFALAGGLIMVSFSNLTMLFLGIEILSISVYVLAGARKRDFFSNEASLKYLLMGAFATGFLLFGITLIYGTSGSFHVVAIKQYITQNATNLPPVFYAGVLLMMIGMAFKISAVPFHFWAPDVYHGSPTAVTTFMATVVKTAGIAALYRLFSNTFGDISDFWSKNLMIISALTITLGNFSAIRQDNVKRMLAYSSVAHAGYFLLAVFSLGNNSTNSILLYATAYSLASIVAFLGLILVQQDSQNELFSAFNGLSKRNPLLAFSIALAVFSMAGIPPAAGFMAKFSVFSAALSKGYVWIIVLAIINSCVGVYYYFKLVKAMYMEKSANETTLALTDLQKSVIVIASILTLLVGIMPQFILNLL
ncbi:MAG: NADH-quinone oxidoreductase subunit N [Bacteroidia bacterium]|nr:NADH-quinone oxidoreductase subunit N [Bacteroidia bacterium]